MTTNSELIALDNATVADLSARLRLLRDERNDLSRKMRALEAEITAALARIDIEKSTPALPLGPSVPLGR